jgi:hypothetical protein
MDRFYSPQNNRLASLVERVKPLFEKMSEIPKTPEPL